MESLRILWTTDRLYLQASSVCISLTFSTNFCKKKYIYIYKNIYIDFPRRFGSESVPERKVAHREKEKWEKGATTTDSSVQAI
jgi:hypothetical protein